PVEASADQGEAWVPLPGRLEAEHEEPVEVPDGQITGWGQRAVWDGAFPLSAVAAPLAGEVQIRLRLSTDRSTRGLGAWVGRLRVLEEGQELFDSDRADDRREVVADGWVLGGWGISPARPGAPRRRRPDRPAPSPARTGAAPCRRARAGTSRSSIRRPRRGPPRRGRRGATGTGDGRRPR